MRKRKYSPPHKYTAAEIRFLKSKVTGRSYAELTEMFNRRFGLTFTVSRLSSAIKRLNMTNGRDCRFQPGHISFNKGKKGFYPAGSEKGWFNPGNKPHTWRPVGTESADAGGYIKVKIRNPRTWKYKHRLVWEKANGKIPRGHIVIFADGNKQNFALENLLLISRRELAVMNRQGLISSSRKLTEIGKTIADLKLLAAKREKELKRRRKSRGRPRQGGGA